MLCLCGYSFDQKVSARRESFAIIRDADYRTFLRAEAKVLAGPDEASRLSAIAQSSRYVGSATMCPDCGRLVMVLPGGETVLVYVLEERRDG